MESKKLPTGKYNRKSETPGLKAQLYKQYLAAGLLLEASEKHRDNHTFKFSLATNTNWTGDFDDVNILFYEEYMPIKLLFSHGEYEENDSNIKFSVKSLLGLEKQTKFSISKYFSSFLSIQSNVAAQFGYETDNIDLILFTNATIDIEKGETDNFIQKNCNEENIIHFGNCNYRQIVLGGSLSREIEDQLNSCSESQRLVQELVDAIVNCKSINVNSGLFKTYHHALFHHVIEVDRPGVGKFKPSVSPNNDHSFIKDLCQQLTLKEMIIIDIRINLPHNFGTFNDNTVQRDLPNDFISRKHIEKFLKKFKLFTGQSNLEIIEQKIKDNFKSMYMLSDNDANDIFPRIMKSIGDFWLTGNQYITENDNMIENIMQPSMIVSLQEPNALFTGRLRELKEIHDALHYIYDDTTELPQIVIISGLGGVGKTDLVRKYAQKYKNYYNTIIWINAESENTILLSLINLARNILEIDFTDKNGQQKDFNAIIGYIFGYFAAKTCLFVYDDAENKTYLKDYLPFKYVSEKNKKIRVIITSRNTEWKNTQNRITVIHLNTLEKSEAMELLQNLLKEFGYKKVKMVAKKLQYLPVALLLAMTFIENENETDNYSMDKYIADYEGVKKPQLSSQIDLDNSYESITYTTWKINLKYINEKQLSFKILQMCAYLSTDHIQREIFYKMENADESRIKMAVKLLVEYGIVIGERKQSILRIHKLVRDAIQIYIKEKYTEEKVLDDTLIMMRGNVTEETLSHLVSLLQHALQYDGLVNNHMAVVEDTIILLNNFNRFKEALQLGDNILNRLDKELLKDATIRVEIFHTRTLMNLGRYVEAVAKCMDILERLGKSDLKSYSKDNTELRTDEKLILFTLAEVYWNAGRYVEAMDILTILERDTNWIEALQILHLNETMAKLMKANILDHIHNSTEFSLL